MRKQQFIDAVYDAGWRANHDAQHEHIEKLWAKLFPTVAYLESQIPDLIETAHQAGQISAGVDPSYSLSKEFSNKTWQS